MRKLIFSATIAALIATGCENGNPPDLHTNYWTCVVTADVNNQMRCMTWNEKGEDVTGPSHMYYIAERYDDTVVLVTP